MSRIRIIHISTMMPPGHYSQVLTRGLHKLPGVDFATYAEKNPQITTIKGCGKVVPVFSQSPTYVYEIVRALISEKPDIVHIQHEMNMYGGLITSVLFPWLVFLCRCTGAKVVVTIHAVVPKKDISRRFIMLFLQNPKFVRAPLLKLFFFYLYYLIGLFSHEIVVHTNLIRESLSDYQVPLEKVSVIPIVIAQHQKWEAQTKPYFLYFGYMVRRKGLEHVLRGFASFLKNNPESQFKLVLAGGTIKGQEFALDEITELIQSLKLDKHVIIKGFVTEKQRDELMKNAYAVVLPAVISIAASGPYQHSQAYHKCVIASDVGNFRESISHMKTGILTRNNLWADALSFAYCNPNLIKSIEQNAAMNAKTHSPENTAKKFMNIYQHVLQK